MRAEIKSHSILDKYTALIDISWRLNSEKNFEQLLKLIADEATKHVDAERATIFMLDKEKNELWAKIALGVSDTIRFDSRLGTAGAVLISGKPMIVEDAYKSPLFYASIDSHTGFHTRNILSVPLRNPKQEVIGVFQVLNKREGRFTTEDEHFLVALANQAAVALENSVALSELERRRQELLELNLHLRREVEERFTSKNIVGTSSKIQEVRSMIDRTAESALSVLVTGENGTGKELSARAIHYQSQRRSKPFVAVNCAALPESLVESELFGIEKGVATGVERRVGRIESANGGTLFLDEIGDLSMTAQAKLLRVLQEREVEWVGGRRPVPVDVRLIAATNKDLKEEIKQNRFRQDLFFRLNVIHIRMP
ncbi:MAG: sigma-54-dependent Fis family transcriptional regulator, partial [Acidobacteria bacterium]